MNTEKTVFALGFFDGVHLGHQALLAQCRGLADRMGLATAAITFENHPQAAFTTEYPPLLTTLADRVALLRHFGMEQVVTLPVNKEVMSTPWRSFLDSMVEKGAVGFVCGDDFRFGSRGEGDARKLQTYCKERGLPCILVPEQSRSGVRISSSHIRRLLEHGQLEQAEAFLGHRHIFTGEVVHGQGLGRQLGTPTANLAVPQGIMLPKKGVYACRAYVQGKSFAAVTNIGIRPTVQGQGVTVEPWLLDFAGDLYGKELTLEFVKFLRPEKKFDSLEALQAEIMKNAQQTRELLR